MSSAPPFRAERFCKVTEIFRNRKTGGAFFSFFAPAPFSGTRRRLCRRPSGKLPSRKRVQSYAFPEYPPNFTGGFFMLHVLNCVSSLNGRRLRKIIGRISPTNRIGRRKFRSLRMPTTLTSRMSFMPSHGSHKRRLCISRHLRPMHQDAAYTRRRQGRRPPRPAPRGRARRSTSSRTP